MKIFKNRQSAGKLLAKHLKQYKGQKNTIVLGIPRGGVVVAAEVAESLKLPLDVLATRKIGAPNQPELALGAVDPDGEVIWEGSLLKSTGFTKDDLQNVINSELAELRRRESAYRQGRKSLNVSGKIVILIDDGIATGSTMLAAVKYLKKHRVKKIVLAVPVASIESVEKITALVSRMVLLEKPRYFQAVGQFYHQFEPVTDEEVVQLMTHGR